MTFPSALHQLPNGTTEAIAFIASLDQCFLTGFANLDTQHQQILASVCRVFTGTPLQQPLADSCDAIQRNEFVEKHFTVLAAARAALQGSLFDTLQQQAREALGRLIVPDVIAESELPEPPAQIPVLLESIRHWLMEIALVGFVRLTATTLTPFMATLEQIQAEPLLVRQAALLTGFFNELMSLVPIADSSAIPTYRWVDLWTQAMLGALRPSPPHASTTVSGTLELLGLDLRHHANFVSFTAYGLLTSDAQTQLVRITMSAYKVDAISSNEIWLLFPNAVPLLDALAQNKELYVTNTPMLPTGDLLWSGNGTVRANGYDLMKNAGDRFSPNTPNAPKPCTIHPGDRHPVQLAEPIFLEGYKVERDGTRLVLNWEDSGVLRVATERISPLSEITKEAIASSTQLFGLLRFDAGSWAVQPLAITVKSVTTKPKTIFTGQNAVNVLKKPPKTSTLATLQERASRLLRKS